MCTVLGSVLFAICLCRQLALDVQDRCSSYIDESNFKEEFGWHLIHADVFRPPSFAK